MLLELRIRNFAIIEEAALEFDPCLNVLSGETGAGKTIILSALGLLLGERASPEMIRAEAKEAVVEGLFELEGEAAPECLSERASDQREILIRRAIADGGRSRVTVDGELGTVHALSKLGAALVQVYGQHEQQSLLRAESHLEVLDGYGGLEGALAEYRTLFAEARALRAALDNLVRRDRERKDLLELARFRVTELEGAGLLPGEDEELKRERVVLANAARLAAAAHESEEMLYGGESAALDILAQAETRLSGAAALDAKLGEPLEMLRAACGNVQEAAHALRAYAGRIEADPARLEEVDNRLQELSRIKRKYGGSLEEALRTLERSRAEIAELDGVEESKARAEAGLERALDALVAAASKLGHGRKRAATELGRRMEAELRSLGMRNPVFEPRLSPLADAGAAFQRGGALLGPEGSDTVEFYLSPNAGQPPMALARIASGGELSRVMLALKRLEAQRRGVATMIFDEVDAGIGGEIAQVVGRKLKQLAQYHQVLCVTHLAQIAAFADRHFHVEKSERRRVTRSRVRMLGEGERADELARMLGGDAASEKFRRAALELLDRARD